MTETDRIEYKRELSPGIDLEEEAVAFLNRREGGILPAIQWPVQHALRSPVLTKLSCLLPAL